MERVFGAGFGYAALRDGREQPLLSGRRLVHITTSGARSVWLDEQGAWNSLRNLFDNYFGKICGMQVHPHIHFDSIVPGLDQRWITETLKTLETKVREYFDPL